MRARWEREEQARRATAGDELEALALDPEPGVRSAVAANPVAGPGVLGRLARDGEWSVRDAVAANPNTPAEVLTMLSTDTGAFVVGAVAANPSTPVDVLRELSGRESLRVAGNAAAPGDLLADLAKAHSDLVRLAVAANPATPPQVLERLAADHVAQVAAAVAANPGVSPELLGRLAESDSEVARLAVAANPVAPARVLDALAGDPSAFVREKVAANPSTERSALVVLGGDPEEPVRREVACHPRVPPEVLVSLATDAAAAVRRVAGSNEAAPDEVKALEALRSGGDGEAHSGTGQWTGVPRAGALEHSSRTSVNRSVVPERAGGRHGGVLRDGLADGSSTSGGETLGDEDRAVLALWACIAARTPVLLLGEPGTGKTTVVRQLAEAAGLPCTTIIASIREPSDFSGLPVLRDDGVVLEAPAWAKALADARDAVLFFDEITTTPPAVQAALLRVVLERSVGELYLGPGVAVVAAANPAEIAAGGWDLAPPLANRFVHLAWPIDVDAVVAGFTSGRFTLPGLRAKGATALQVGAQKALVGSYLSRDRHRVLERPDDPRAASGPWPSPRTWEMAAGLLAQGLAMDLPEEVRFGLVAGCVGAGAAASLFAWLAEGDLPDPEEVLSGPSSFVLPDRGDRALAALSSVVSAVSARPTPERWEACGHVLQAVAAKGRLDLVVAVARPWAACQPPGCSVPAFLGDLERFLR